jgi:hypothetical protein
LPSFSFLAIDNFRRLSRTFHSRHEPVLPPRPPPLFPLLSLVLLAHSSRQRLFLDLVQIALRVILHIARTARSLHHNPANQLCLDLRFLGLLCHLESCFFEFCWTTPRSSTGCRVILLDAVIWHRFFSNCHISVKVQLQFGLLQPALEDIRFVPVSKCGVDSIVVSLIKLRFQGDAQRAEAKDLENLQCWAGLVCPLAA